MKRQQFQPSSTVAASKQLGPRVRPDIKRPSLATPAESKPTPKTKPEPPVIMVTEQVDEKMLSKTSLLTSTDSSSIIRPLRRPDAPYIRPTKFVPVLDYFSSSSDREEIITGGNINPKWKPGEKEDQLAKWRKVTYEVPRGGARARRRDSLSSLVDKNMQEMNKQFKANISQLSQGLCYNHMERKIHSDLGDHGGKGQFFN